MQRHGVTQKKGSVALWKAFSYDAVTVCSLALVYRGLLSFDITKDIALRGRPWPSFFI